MSLGLCPDPDLHSSLTLTSAEPLPQLSFYLSFYRHFYIYFILHHHLLCLFLPLCVMIICSIMMLCSAKVCDVGGNWFWTLFILTIIDKFDNLVYLVMMVCERLKGIDAGFVNCMRGVP